jgi:hypothetical protein
MRIAFPKRTGVDCHVSEFAPLRAQSTLTLNDLQGVVARYFCLVFGVLAAPAWAANKCTGPNGKVTFSDLPCAEDESSAKLKAPAPSPEAGTAARPSGPQTTEQTRARSENELRNPQLRAECRALVMQLSELEKLGNPSSATEVQAVKAKLNERCFSKMTDHLQATKASLKEQDRIESARVLESIRGDCENLKAYIAKERAKLAREPRDNTFGLELKESQYKERCSR